MSQKLHGNGFKWVENTSKSHNKNEYVIHIRNLKEALNHHESIIIDKNALIH